MKFLSKKQAGETIVEVLMAILVITVALAGAFAISNRSMRTIQANQERYQAQILANSQADLLRNYLTSGGSRSFVNTSTFCVSGISVKTSGSSECLTTGPSDLYNISIACQNVTTNNVSVCGNLTSTYNVYKITITWDSLIGSNSSGKDNVELWCGA